MANFIEEIKEQYRSGDALNRLILINLGVYLLYVLLRIFSFLFQINLAEGFIEWTALPSSLFKLATRPWTLVTYMFLHQGFIHILFNMLWLYFGGQIFMQYFGGRRLISTYLIGGLLGGLLYVVFYNLFPAFSEVVLISNNRGASAGVMAVIVAIATYNPRYPVRLFFVLTIPLWGVAAIALVADLISLGDGENAGGRLAHLGGAAFGYFMASRYKQNGTDLTEGFSQLLDRLANFFSGEPKLRKVHQKSSGSRRGASRASSGSGTIRNPAGANDEERLNAILDKIRVSGYDSLSKDEKEYLFKIGKD